MIHKQLVSSRWFSFADLTLVSASVVIWEIRPQFGWVPLLISLVPWLIRLGARRFPVERTGLEVPLLVFLLTAAVGAWAAYEPVGAAAKFWLLVGGVLLYYAIAGQPQQNLWTIAGFLELVGVGVAVFFLLAHDWQSSPAELSVLNEIGLWWLRIRPDLGVAAMNPNSAGGVIAITAPFQVSLGMRAWREKRALLGLGAILGGCVMAAAFLLATSRGAALALAAGFAVWAWWHLSEALGRRLRRPPGVIFVCGLSGLIVVGVGLILTYPGGPVGIAKAIPVPPGASGRLELAEGTVDLIGDFPFTGGGLNAFPGLYAHYIRDIPHYVTLNSHNHYLDVGLEQGVLGALAFLAVYLGSIWLLLIRDWESPGAILTRATGISLLIIMVHGLIDNLVYDRWGAPLVFLVPGVAFAVTRSTPQRRRQHLSEGPLLARLVACTRFRSLLFVTALVVMATLSILFYPGHDRLSAAWYADLGAVRLARYELVDFPSHRWVELAGGVEVDAAVGLFEKALEFNVKHRAANYHLGRITTDRRDFPAAVSYLETAHTADRRHRGIRKELGYAYVWAGQSDQAAALLADIPEADYELRNYAWWWGTLGRDDLADRAVVMRDRLESQATAP